MSTGAVNVFRIGRLITIFASIGCTSQLLGMNRVYNLFGVIPMNGQTGKGEKNDSYQG